MPATKEFTLLIEDRPGTLGKVCRALADRKVNILALQSFPIGGKSVTRFIVDNPTTAKTVLDGERLTYTEAEVVQVKLPHRPGEIARAASRLGEANININYVYCGLEAGTNAPLVFFGVNEVGQAAPLLDQAAARRCQLIFREAASAASPSFVHSRIAWAEEIRTNSLANVHKSHGRPGQRGN